MVAPEMFLMMAPASDAPVLEICSEPMASTDAASFCRSWSNCLMSLLTGANWNGLSGGGLGGGGGARCSTVGFAAVSAAFFSVRSPTAKPPPADAGASTERRPLEAAAGGGASAAFCAVLPDGGGGGGGGGFDVSRMAPMMRMRISSPTFVVNKMIKMTAKAPTWTKIETQTPVRSFFLTLG